MSFYNILDAASNLFMHFASGPMAFLGFVTVISLLLGTLMDPAPAMMMFCQSLQQYPPGR